MSMTTDQLEARAETHRTHISELIDELRDRVTPGEVVDEFLGWEDGHEIARTFGRQVRSNPLPLALIGTGIAWLMMTDSSRRYRPAPANDGYGATAGAMQEASRRARNAADRVSDAAQSTRDYASGLSDRASETASNLSDTAQSAMESARQRASDLADKTQSAYASAKQSMSDTAGNIADTASSTWQRATDLAQSTASGVSDAGANLNRFAHDQPLLTAGIGFALGMALGAILPMSDVEHDLMGERSDELKERAGDLASEGIEKAKSVAQKTYEAAADAASDEAERQGLTQSEPQRDDMSGDSAEIYGGEDGGDYGAGAYRHH